MLIDYMLSTKDITKFYNKYRRTLIRIEKASPFTLSELEALSLIYHKMELQSSAKRGQVSTADFRSLCHFCFDMSDDSLIEQVVVALNHGPSRFITIETWIEIFSLWLHGNLESKIKYCFSVYDYMGDGVLKRSCIMNYMGKTMTRVYEGETEETVRDLVDLMVKKMDIDHDGSISFLDYQTTVRKNPGLLECFGKCIPSRESVFAFLSTFTSKIGHQ